MSAIPGDGEIRALHERFAPTRDDFDRVWTHCVIVCRIAERLLAGRPEDVALVRAGCLLHDIGVYRLHRPDGTFDHAGYIRHGILGHESLRALGFPELLCRFCSRHTGVGLTRADIRRQALPLPPADYVARSPEERLVMYADKFHSKSTPPTFLTAATYRSEVARFGEEKAAAFAQMVTEYGEPNLEPLAAAHGHALR